MRDWETLSSTLVLDSPWFRVRRDVCRLPNGIVLDDYYLWEGRDWVAVFALTTEGTVLLVRQYRQGVRQAMWELPGGLIDAGEDMISAGLRELREETGYLAASAEPLGRMAVDPPKATFSNHLLLARGCQRAGQPAPDRTEEIELCALPPATLLSWVREGRIWAQSSVACIYRALDHLSFLPAGTPTP
ncbi:MAG: NUDIX hydrolase [Chloroflexia bacterium]